MQDLSHSVSLPTVPAVALRRPWPAPIPAAPAEVDVAATGMTGYVGAATLGRLLDAGLRVRLLVRTPSRLAALGPLARHSALSVVQAPVADADALHRLFRGARVCLHAAALADPAWVAAQPGLALTANLELTAAVVRAAQDSAGTEATLMLLSSLSVYGGATTLCRHDTPPAPNTAYGWQKLTGERMVLAGMRRALILRPGTCTGALPEASTAYRGDLFFNHVLAEAVRQRAGRAGPPWRLRGARQMRPYVHVADVGRLITALCRQVLAGHSLPGPVLNLVSPQGNLDRRTVCTLAADAMPGFDVALDDAIDLDDPRDCRVACELGDWGLGCEQPDPADWARELAAFHLARDAGVRS